VKAILSILAFLCFAVMYAVAVLARPREQQPVRMRRR
jgi:hypothetical protein